MRQTNRHRHFPRKKKQIRQEMAWTCNSQLDIFLTTMSSIKDMSIKHKIVHFFRFTLKSIRQLIFLGTICQSYRLVFCALYGNLHRTLHRTGKDNTKTSKNFNDVLLIQASYKTCRKNKRNLLISCRRWHVSHISSTFPRKWSDNVYLEMIQCVLKWI